MDDEFEDLSELEFRLNMPVTNEPKQVASRHSSKGLGRKLRLANESFFRSAEWRSNPDHGGKDGTVDGIQGGTKASEACIKIQRIFRGREARRFFLIQRENAAALKIQSRFRGDRARRSTKHLGAKIASFRQRNRITVFKTSASLAHKSKAQGGEMLNLKHFMSEAMVNVAVDGAGMFGQLKFVGDSGRRKLDMNAAHIETARQAKFCRVRVQRNVSTVTLERLAPEQQAIRLDLLRGLVSYIKFGWKVPMPSVILEFTGSAEGVYLRPAFFAKFGRSLVSATRSTGAWVVTGGTDGGIMKLVGDALSTVNSSEVSLGICSWGTVHGRSRLEERTFANTAGTVRVTFSDTDEAYIRESKVDLREHLRQMFSRYGHVSGINAFRLQASDPNHNKVEMAERLLEGEPSHQRRWFYVTFENRTTAARATELQRAKMAGRAMTLNTVCVDNTRSVAQRRTAERGIPTALGGIPTALGSVGRSGGRADPNETAQRRSYLLHMDILANSRGSHELPYMYDGKRDFYREGGTGAALNPNHTHYVMVDDDSEGRYHSEIAIRSDLLEFISYRRDREACSAQELQERCARKLGSRVVPVITIVFGGGRGTYKTLMDAIANSKPIVVCKGSGRFADLIADWKNLHSDMLELVNSDSVSHQIALASMRERQHALARAWCCNPNQKRCGPLTEEDILPDLTDDPRSADIADLRYELDTIIAYPELHIFNTDDRDKDLLSVVLRSIFDSPTINNSVKVPLAIRNGSHDYIERIMMRYGSKRLVDLKQELSSDSRLLTYAAFHDDADAVQTLSDWGFDIEAIDNLIFLELHQLAELVTLDKTKEFEPPRSWISAYRQQQLHKTQARGEDLHTKWLSMSVQEQVSEAKKEWAACSSRKQYQIVRADICRVSWEKMPFLPGWTYRAVHFLGKVSKGYGDTAREQHLGQRFMLLRVQRHLGASMTAELSSPSGSIVKGIFIRQFEAQQLVAEFIDECNLPHEERLQDVFALGCSTWIALHDPDIPMQMINWGQRPNVLLQQQTFDSVVSALDINEDGYWIPGKHEKQRHMSKLLTHNALKAFKDWIDVDSIEIGVPWWEMPRSGDEGHTTSYSLYEYSLDPLHRVFWAVMTGRNNMAEMLWNQLPARGAFAGAFLATYAIGHANTSSEAIASRYRRSWDRKTLHLLDEVQQLADPDCTRAVFDQYLYFGLEEQMYAENHPELPTKYAALSDAQKLDNAKRRVALQLMGCDIEQPKTRVDLALAANCQAFLGHAATEQFMDYLWASHSFDSWFEAQLRGTVLSVLTIPRVKNVGYLISWILFGAMFAAVYSSFEPPTRMNGMLHRGRDLWTRENALEDAHCTLCMPWEVIFWLWVGGQMLNEAYQFVVDFESSVAKYAAGSGNLLDGLIQATFFIAFLLRVVSLMLWQREDDLSQDEMQRCDDNYPACHLYLTCLFLLGFNVITVGIRILYSLSIFREIGILLLIVRDIVLKDVVPFVCVLMIFIVCFEVAGIFFFLASDQDFSMYDAGSYFLTWIDVGNMPDLSTALGHERWLNSAFQQRFNFVTSAHFIYKIGFFVISGIILTNLLIAMMSDRFANVQAAATQIWRAQFSGQVREFCDAPVFPVPFNLLELLLSTCTRENFEAEMHLLDESEQEEKSAVWGRHYIWPLATNKFDLLYATQHKGITSATCSREMAELQAIRATQLQVTVEAKKRDQYKQQFRKGAHNGQYPGVLVKILDRNAVETHSVKLAEELGVHQLWQHGKEHNRIDSGFHVIVHRVPPDFEDERNFVDVFSRFGSVLAASVRKRSGRYDDGEAILSWALVSFTTLRAVDNAVNANAQQLPHGLRGLRTSHLDPKKVIASTGELPVLFRKHASKAESCASYGVIVSETGGVSSVVGERVCAVRLHCDGRVLLVRRSGLHEVSQHIFESEFGQRLVDVTWMDEMQLPSLDDDNDRSSSHEPSHPDLRSTMCTPATSAHANMQAASLATNALRAHGGDPHVQRAAQRLHALLNTMDTMPSGR